eukprot:4250584-Karenia_brevis.AAC.1
MMILDANIKILDANAATCPCLRLPAVPAHEWIHAQYMPVFDHNLRALVAVSYTHLRAHETLSDL